MDPTQPSPFLPQGQSPLPNPQPPVPQPETPDDMGGLADRWRGWINQPDNRAALMQFGIAMLQPMVPGESTLTHGANALGSAGEAASTVHETEAKRAGEASLADYRDRTVGARQDTADARMVSANKGGQVTATSSFTAKMRQDAAFRKWASSPEDIINGDPIVKALGAKNKAEIIADPTLREKARKLYQDIGEGGSGAAPETGPVGGLTTDTGGQEPTLDQRRAAPAPKLADAIRANPNIQANLVNLKQRFLAGDPDAKAGIERLKQVVADPEAVDRFIGSR